MTVRTCRKSRTGIRVVNGLTHHEGFSSVVDIGFEGRPLLWVDAAGRSLQIEDIELSWSFKTWT